MTWEAVTPVAQVLSPFLAVMLSVWASNSMLRRHERRALKLDLLRRLVASRSGLVPSPADTRHVADDRSELRRRFESALNEVFVVFNDRRVTTAVTELNAAAMAGLDREAQLKELFEAMCKELKLPVDDSSLAMFMRPFRADNPPI